MSIKFKCPECGKSYVVKDKLQGRKCKCACGAVIQVPSNTISKVSVPIDTGTLPDKAEICEKCLKTIPAGSDRVVMEGHLYCIDCAKRTEHMKQTLSLYQENKYDDLDSDVIFFDREKILKKNFLARLLGCSVGVLIGCTAVYIKGGLSAAIFGGIIGVVFVYLMVKKGHEYDLKATKDKETYRKYKAFHKKRLTRVSNTPQSKLAIALFILMLCISLVFITYQLINKRGYDELLDLFASFFTTHIRLKLILLLANIPVFVLIGRVMVGSWGKYWRVNKWNVIPLVFPFLFLFKGWWKFIETISIEEIILVWAVDELCFVVYLMEYFVIKVLFLG